MANEKKYNKGYWQKKDKPVYKPKRGELSSLMTEEAKQKAGIHELSYDFGCRMVRLYQYLTDSVQGSGFMVNGSWLKVHDLRIEENVG